MSRIRSLSPQKAAGLIVVWAVAWSPPFGQTTWDTKYDLLVNPWGFLGRSLHLWDPQVNWGGLANQGYGYLFPMGPFFAVLSEVMPVWVVQRLWWGVLLTAGFLGMCGLLRELGIARESARVIGGLSWVLAPKVIGSVAVLSAEIMPQILAPLALWPVVAAWRGTLDARRASLFSGAVMLCMGGVNGAATVLAIVPTGLFVITRARWWASRLTWYWVAAVVAATAWWLGPLLLMARYSPPFLSWIETSAVVSGPIGLLDVLRGTTHWLGHLLTSGGAWWPAGYELATSSWLIVLTTVVAAVGLCGLARRDLPIRGFLWLSLVTGVVAMSLAHDGPAASPLVSHAQAALDGPLAAFRNIHKTDVLVRLPLIVGFSHLLGVVAAADLSRSGRWVRIAGRSAPGLSAVLVIAAASPAFTGAVAFRGGHEEIPQHWVELGAWLDDRADDSGSLLVPAASFGEYGWGRTVDEPLRSLTHAPFGVRDAVPLAPAGTVRLLDAVERRLQTGRSLDGAVSVLAASGTRFLIVRNDLSSTESGQPPVALARSAVRATTGVQFTRGFGRPFEDITGEYVSPLEVYEIEGAVAAPMALWPASDVVGSNGATDDLITLADAGLPARPVVFDGDRVEGFSPGRDVLTDGLRARHRYFGATRGQDATPTLTSVQQTDARDYRPWPSPELLSSVAYRDIRDVTASSSLADDLTFAGLHPATRPFAALDGDPQTAWLAIWDPSPTLTIELNETRHLDHLEILPYAARAGQSPPFSAPTEIIITTDQGQIAAQLGTQRTRVDLPDGPTSRLSIEITETENGPPERRLTGFGEVLLPTLTPLELLETPRRTVGSEPRGIALSAGLEGRDGCLVDEVGMRCLGGETVDPEISGTSAYRLTESAKGEWTLSGTMRATPSASALAGSPSVEVSGSSARSDAPAGQPTSVVDGDPRTAWSPSFEDRTPELTFTFPSDTVVTEITLQARGFWAALVVPMIRVSAGGQEFNRWLTASGQVTIPPTTTQTVRLEFLPPNRWAPIGSLELEEVTFAGVELMPAQTQVAGECGHGPELTANGRAVPTQITATRDGWLGLDAVRWEACELATLTGVDDVLTVGAWEGFAPALTTGTRTSSESAAHVGRAGATAVTTQIEADDDYRLLVLTQNSNPGWEATIGGEPLASQVVDGRRQGFTVPPGAAGELAVTFAPDRTYRTLLFGGGALALALVASMAIAAVRQGRAQPGLGDHVAMEVTDDPNRRLRPMLVWIAAGALGGLVAGPVGLGSALVGVGLGLRLRDPWRVVVIGVLTAGAGVAQALIAPAWLSPEWLELTVRCVLIAAVAAAWSASQSTGKARGRQLDQVIADGG